MKREYIILTGCTGMLGERLLADLLNAKVSVVAIVRPKSEQSGRDRVQQILDSYDLAEIDEHPQLEVLEGDINQPSFGLDASEVEWLKQHAGTIVHNAACLQFKALSPTGEPWNTNLNGTRHMLELAKLLKVENLCYVSTAYVCGTRTGLIGEDELDLGQTFRNDYEESKCRAEKMVRDRFSGRLTVVRPAVIVGDSRDGHTSGYHGLYKFFQFTWVSSRSAERDAGGTWHHDVRLRMNGDEHRNLITVDWVSAAMTEIICRDELHGRTYHLTPRTPTTSRQIEQALAEYFQYRGVRFVGGETSVPDATSTPAEVAYYQSMEMFADYWGSEPLFDATNLWNHLPDLEAPLVDVDSLLRMIDFAVTDRWGKKKRRPKAVVAKSY